MATTKINNHTQATDDPSRGYLAAVAGESRELVRPARGSLVHFGVVVGHIHIVGLILTEHLTVSTWVAWLIG